MRRSTCGVRGNEWAFDGSKISRRGKKRVSVSVMANIAEGFDCESHAEFARFLGFARRSAVEVQSLLYAALDAGYITPEIFKTTYEWANKAKAMVSAFKSSLQRRN